jgi:uncharacterized protein (TIGR02300 family)
VAKPELGTKRVCPTTGRKFYDLNRDPIVSPFTGQAFQRSFFEPQAKAVKAEADDEVEMEPAANVELVSLEEADAESAPDSADPALDVDVDVEVEDDADEDDTFLEEDEENDDDVADLIDGDIETDEET